MRVVASSAKCDLDRVLLHQIDAAYSFARWAVGHPAAAEDVITALLMGDLEAPAKNQDVRARGHEGRARTWVLREVRVAALRHLRSAARQDGGQAFIDTGSQPYEASSFSDLIVPAQLGADIGARAAGMDLQYSAVQRLRCAVASLSLEQREVVLLRDTEGLSYREIASLTGLQRATVVSRLWRARDALEQGLTGFESVPPEHEQAPALIDAYIDSEVDISNSAAFVQHIAGCRDCAERLLKRSRLVRHIRTVTECCAPEGLRRRVEGQIRA
jgi:RNA polymerase sigma factor (sigma-70 family)